MNIQTRFLALCALLAGGWLAGCVPQAEQPPLMEADPIQIPLTVTLKDSVVVRGGGLTLHIEGGGLLRAHKAHVELQGRVRGHEVRHRFDATPETDEDGLITVRVDAQALWSTIARNEAGAFEGSLRCELWDVSSRIWGMGERVGVHLSLIEALDPELRIPSRWVTHLGEIHSWSASGLLREGEGTSWAEWEGQFETDSGDVEALHARVPLRLGGGGRAEALFRWHAAMTGIVPGRFEGRLRVVNAHRHAEPRVGAWQSVEVDVAEVVFWGFEPARVSRGQRLKARGQGFVGLEEDMGAKLYFKLEGTFHNQQGGAEPVSWLWSPEDVERDGASAGLALRTETRRQDGREVLTGMSARVGRFEGTTTPMLLDGHHEAWGEPRPTTLIFNPTHQVVFVRFLPDYLESLERFGLRNQAPEVQARIFSSLRSHFEGLNISWTDARPEGWLEYTTVEIGGVDPNGAGLLGLDNTEGKDVGNLRLDDVIGGQNARLDAQGYYAFGGVFIDSLVSFSPTLSPQSALASPSFDTLFGPSMPELGGQPLGAGQTHRPEARRAISAMGDLIAHTVAHELGHALGLALHADGRADLAHEHNEGDEPGAIMDAGAHRPFEERCGLDGAHSAHFNDVHWRYLESILGLP